MKKCLTYGQIEKLVLRSAFYGETTLPNHINSCNFCKTAYKRTQNFYLMTQNEFHSISISDRVEELQKRLHERSPNQYYLDVLNLLPISKPVSRVIHTLAADSGTVKTKPRTKNVGVFASTDGRLMVRILCNPQGEYTLFLIAESPDLYANVIVSILGIEGEYITDQQGRINLGSIDLPPVEKLGIEVKTAQDSFDLNQVFVAKNVKIGEGSITLERKNTRQIKLEILPAGSSYSLKVTIEASGVEAEQEKVRVMVVRDQSHPRLKHVIRGVALFQDIEHPANLQIKIFE